jgi:hypothetical protein
MPAIAELQNLTNEISDRISDLSRGNENMVSMALSLVIIKLLNAAYPPNLSPINVALILENYPEATQEDLDQRALSKPGLMTALVLFQQASAIVMDYSPLTNTTKEREQDVADVEKQYQAMSIANKAYDDMIAIGYTSLGVMTTMTSTGLSRAKDDGAPSLKLARPLIEFMASALEPTDLEKQEDEEQLIETLCNRLRISKAAARRYIKKYSK